MKGMTYSSRKADACFKGQINLGAVSLLPRVYFAEGGLLFPDITDTRCPGHPFRSEKFAAWENKDDLEVVIADLIVWWHALTSESRTRMPLYVEIWAFSL